MKKAMIYICALTLAFSALLAGCGETRRTDGGAAAPTATPAPEATILPETMMPDAADGEVRDRDGIITDSDSGNTEKTPKARAGTDAAGKTTTGTTGTAKR